MNTRETIMIILLFVVLVISFIIFTSCSDGHRYDERSYEVSEDFSTIAINSDIEDIIFTPSTDDKCRRC